MKKIYKIFVKSKFHRSLYPNIPDDKFVVLPNGIDPTVFDGIGKRDPRLLINTSSADRSLETFLDCFEDIKKQVPDTKAVWAYGWGVWDHTHSSDMKKMEWKAMIQARMKELGVTEAGRLSHSGIASLYLKANIFGYPSEFAEIDCISLSKAMAGGAIPITTDFAAMGEKAKHGGVFIHSEKTKDDWARPYQFHFEMTGEAQKKQFVDEAVKFLLNPPSEKAREDMRERNREFSFEELEFLDRVPCEASGIEISDHAIGHFRDERHFFRKPLAFEFADAKVRRLPICEIKRPAKCLATNDALRPDGAGTPLCTP